MKQKILSQLGDFTKKFKLNEEEYMKKYKEFMGEEFNPNISMLSPESTDKSKKQENFLMTDEKNSILAKRDSEISTLLTSINELAQIFKDMQVLVMEQGTILDRIDYNIDVASVQIEAGQKNLIQAEKHMKKNCARKAILVIMSIDFILAVMLIFKFIV